MIHLFIHNSQTFVPKPSYKNHLLIVPSHLRLGLPGSRLFSRFLQTVWFRWRYGNSPL